MKKITVEITFEDDNVVFEIRNLVEDFCVGLQEDILPDAKYTVAIGEDNSVTV